MTTGRDGLEKELNLCLAAVSIIAWSTKFASPTLLVLPSIRSHTKPLSEGAMISALRRMGYTKEEMTPHGFRSAASTILNERGFNPDVIEAALAHQDENEIRRAYNRSLYWPERVKLMQAWADLLDEFKQLSASARSAA